MLKDMRSMKSKIKAPSANDDLRQMEADKTSRLRALRFAKEAAEREATTLAAAIEPPKPARRRSRAADQQASGS